MAQKEVVIGNGNPISGANLGLGYYADLLCTWPKSLIENWAELLSEEGGLERVAESYYRLLVQILPDEIFDDFETS